MASSTQIERNPFSRVGIGLLLLAVLAGSVSLAAGARWGLVPVAVLFGWTQIGSL